MKASYRGEGTDGSDYLPEGSCSGGVFAYVRRSVMDKSGKPLETQIKTIQNYIKEYSNKNLDRQTEVRQWYGDNGIAGSSDIHNRPGLKAFFDFLDSEEGKKIDKDLHLVVYDPSRFARSVEVGIKIKSILSKKAVTLHIATTNTKVEGSESNLFFGLNLSMAESERKSCMERTRKALQQKDWDPRVGFGWTFIDGVKTEIEEEQKTLCMIKDLYQSGEKVSVIAKYLNDNSMFKRDEKIWTGTNISFICRKNNFVWVNNTNEVITITNKQELIEKIKEYKDQNPDDCSATNFINYLKTDGKKVYYLGAKLIKSSITKYLPDDAQDLEVMRKIKFWIKEGKYSNDDIVEKLNEDYPKKEGKVWLRQATWRRIKTIRDEIESERIKQI